MDHYQEYFSDKVPPFGKYQRVIAIVIFMGFQAMLYTFGCLTIYAICTLNFNLIILLGAVSALQSLTRRSQLFIDWVNDVLQLRRYSKGCEFIFQEEIKEDNKCLFGIHPHGVLSIAVMGTMNSKKKPFTNLVGLSSRLMLACPFVGFFLRLWGCEGVDPHHMKFLMKQGKNISLVPGGFEEATLTSQKELRIYIQNRKGFIKYAIEHNYSIYPVISLNEHQSFWTFDYFTKFRLFLNKFKLPGVIFWNRKSLVFLPTDLQYYTVIGKKIDYRPLQAGEAPTQSQIDKTHYKYIQQLKRIYEKFKHLNGNAPLKIY